MEKFTTSNPKKLKSILDKYGVAILSNYFSEEYADEVFDSVHKWMVGLGFGLGKKKSSWINANLPLGPKYGMYQSIVSNAPKFWDVREKFYPIFQTVLGKKDLIVSVDGASFFPTILSPKNKKDWAHIDQTISSKMMCLQSQFVASDMQHSFVRRVPTNSTKKYSKSLESKLIAIGIDFLTIMWQYYKKYSERITRFRFMPKKDQSSFGIHERCILLNIMM